MEIEFTDTAKKQLKDLQLTEGKKIINYLTQIKTFDNPMSRGKALTENYKNLWRYRVGDYRIICKIEPKKLLITVLKIGHRSSIYK